MLLNSAWVDWETIHIAKINIKIAKITKVIINYRLKCTNEETNTIANIKNVELQIIPRYYLKNINLK